jgi:hypothetical protein
MDKFLEKNFLCTFSTLRNFFHGEFLSYKLNLKLRNGRKEGKKYKDGEGRKEIYF